MEAFSAVSAVALERVLNDRKGDGRALNVVDFHRFPFQVFVVLEKPPKHHETVRGQLGGFTVAVEFGITDGNSEDLVVGLSAIDHGHQPDGPGGDESHGSDGFLAEN